ncbi:T9SS type B sorting domain-containing protein [Confluentibacter citreus]|uniref:T9SS type B sorting domain-containing protein n=1 Tax=Confluentibacter citreus TaxID=2007307 RepID=UPI000C284FD8|nr:T9SS type B sorting domain-containing protein [Confluentibacter citreus]
MNIKTLLTLILIPLNFCIGISQNTFVPDDNFERALIELGLDTAPLDDFVLTANIRGVTSLNLRDKNISDLTGIEDFAALSVLNCDENNLTSLNISQNTNLTQLFCRDNQLTSLDTSQNTNLNILWVESNQLTGLDLSRNNRLISLITNNNPLNVLDVTNNRDLRVLYCENNQLSNLDITRNVSLKFFNVNNNSLTSLNTSNNIELTEMACGDNLITALDISKNINLVYFWCPKNQLTNLDVTKNLNLVQLIFGDNQISSIDLSRNTKLELLWAAQNLLMQVDVSKNILLQNISLSINNITNFDVSKNSNISWLDIDYNNLCYLNIKNGNNTNIESYSSINNPFLSCIFVDNIAYSSTNWTNIDAASNFVTNQTECDAFGNNTLPVDTLNDFVGIRYILPTISNGNYFTEPGGNGTALYAGDVITTSQTIYIFNDIDCYSNESSFKVTISDGDYYIPKFFTPNNDGTHDYWQVYDNANVISAINIYNRYGKLLKSLAPNSEGWNGTFNGRLLESDDYWYAITLNTGEVINGHFSLKR